MEKFVPYHQHLIVKCWLKNPPREVERLNDWFTDLVHTVDMKVVAGPTSVYVSDPGNEGLTGTVTLATSHASIHVWDQEDPAMAQFDIYSCKPYQISDVLTCLKKWQLVRAEWVLIDRNEKIEIMEKGCWNFE